MSDREQDVATTLTPDKGKAKERQDHDLASTPSSSSERLEETAYPPAGDDTEETRRVEENLRRWEVAERQRRKSARESQGNSTGASLVSDVSRRASLLFSGRKAKQHSISSLGNHTALRSRDSIDVVPLNEAQGRPLPSPSLYEHDTDPFANPQDIPLSPFDDVHATNKVGSQASQPLLREPSTDTSLKPDTTSENQSQTLHRPPPIKPLDLPSPRTPPPVDTPPPPINPPTPSSPSGFPQKEVNVRWWHDWLCGCSEGLDRGGDHQAGRTNPNE